MDFKKKNTNVTNSTPDSFQIRGGKVRWRGRNSGGGIQKKIGTQMAFQNKSINIHGQGGNEKVVYKYGGKREFKEGGISKKKMQTSQMPP